MLVGLIFIFCIGATAGVGLILAFLPYEQSLSTLTWKEYDNEFLIGALILGSCTICSIVSGLVLLAQKRDDLPERTILLGIALLSLLGGFLIIAPLLIVFLWIYKFHLASKRSKEQL